MRRRQHLRRFCRSHQPTRTTRTSRIDSPESDDSLRGRDSSDPLRPVPPRRSSSAVFPVPDSTALPQAQELLGRSSCWCLRPPARSHLLQTLLVAIYPPSSRPVWLPTAPRLPGALPHENSRKLLWPVCCLSRTNCSTRKNTLIYYINSRRDMGSLSPPHSSTLLHTAACNMIPTILLFDRSPSSSIVIPVRHHITCAT